VARSVFANRGKKEMKLYIHHKTLNTVKSSYERSVPKSNQNRHIKYYELIFMLGLAGLFLH